MEHENTEYMYFWLYLLHVYTAMYIFHMLFASSLQNPRTAMFVLKLYPTIVVDLRPNSRDTGTKAKVKLSK